MLVSVSLLIIVICGFVYCKKKGVNSLIVQLLLQIIGVLGLLGLHGNGLTIIAALYMVAIIVINGDKSDDWNRILGTSPIYTVIILGFLFAVSNELPRSLFPSLPHLNLSPFVGSASNLPAERSVVFVPFAISVLGLSVFLVWKKTHSIFLSFISLLPLLLIVFYILMILSASNFRPGL